MLLPVCSFAAQNCLPEDSSGFFTNFAAQLLQTDLKLSLTRIQLYPTNQYSPAVHRLLQLAANLYDATTNRFPLLNGTNQLQAPTVFRPIFRRNPGPEATNVFIAGYREVTQLDPILPLLVGAAPGFSMIDLENSADRTRFLPLGTPFRSDPNEPMVYGVPLVIGARQGFPNFNKFALQNAVTVTRKLQFHRLTGGPMPTFTTNQLYLLAISNSFGVQAWNSYLSNFTRSVEMIVAGDVSLALTNELGPIWGPDDNPLTNGIPFVSTTNISGWPGFVSLQTMTNGCFQVPLLTNCVFLSNSVFVHDLNGFVTSSIPDRANYFPVPNWVLSVKTRLRYVLIDTGSGRILDYVNLSASEVPLNIMGVMRGGNTCGGYGSEQQPNLDPGGLWCTNRAGDERGLQFVDNPHIPTIGILNQLQISDGTTPVTPDWWTYYNSVHNEKDAEIEVFDRRMFGDLAESTDPADIDFAAPFNPRRTLFQYVRWEANDPFVHYTVSDLTDQLGNTNKIQWDVNTSIAGNPVARLSGANPLADHYRPWGGNPVHISGSDQTTFLISLKDPQVTRSDDWNFPSGEPLSLAMLGRVHRGTPWQTVYLKSAAVDSNLWRKWTGMTDNAAALASLPTNDWRLATLLGLMLNTNDPRHLLSINDPDTNAWLEALDGLSVITNSSPPVELIMSSNSPQAALIVAAIQQARAARPSQQFIHLGDLLATPQLTLSSPWLNANNLNSFSAPTDEACEMIPSQLLPLLREDSIGSIISATNQIIVQFSGYDHAVYAIEVSPDLVHWIPAGIKHPRYGVFGLPFPAPSKARHWFYRSVLLPLAPPHCPKKFLFYRPHYVFIDDDESRHFGRGQRHAHGGAHQ